MSAPGEAGSPSGAAALEALLARVYVDPDTRERFLSDPVGEARRAGLDESACRSLTDLDRAGLRLAARSFAAKRRHKHAARPSWLQQLLSKMVRLTGRLTRPR